VQARLGSICLTNNEPQICYPKINQVVCVISGATQQIMAKIPFISQAARQIMV